MNATKKTRRKHVAKPVTETLLELAYFLHATKVIGVRAVTSEPRRHSAPKGQRSKGEGSSLAS
ncbi:unnamed protein product [Gemmata massiliana]|uniref:Uncharacterized protein n=1 Tax=Gemmata massiliana TaxID=1210884 RepID=A0A6P2CV83_9BACT|nr:hypothetical protein [Gemmata massiliana]VTR91614.1 unnamed protein product [Gemmata massiliana]